ncbi:unnamed protein product [Onchocerca ochengi]|uniref:Uncharacterized protein n=1 Tax=Onchocerca ochengi TaxID=42157 RepID=A0A182E223_ONCOC|nr:unnamed protein product [Onchocerca ochengi]
MRKPVLLITLLSVVSVVWSADPNTCGKLIRCAIRKCFSTAKTNESTNSSSGIEIFNNMINQFNFICIATKCRDPCTACEQCNYALEQFSKILRGLKTDMKCPKMETCLLKCLHENAFQFGACARERCNPHCFDDECSYCTYLARRIFLKICRENNIPTLSNVNFNGKCIDLVNNVLKEVASSRKT